MTDENSKTTSASRRRFLKRASLLAVATAPGIELLGGGIANAATKPVAKTSTGATEPFYGEHQGGILTPVQRHSYFAAFDVTSDNRDDVVKMLQSWTDAAARMARGETVQPIGADMSVPAGDTAEALELPPARLTITFGFGAGLFTKDGKDRFGLAANRPEALIDLPHFAGDQLMPDRTGGDLSVQACADDPQVVFHAVRQLNQLAYGTAQIRWAQIGFSSSPGGKKTPRNLMGFKDGTANPSVADPQAMAKTVWVGPDGAPWMRGGSYLVVRRIRIALEHWDRMNVGFQEQTVGRHKYSGAPLGGKSEFEPLNLNATDKDGNPIIPENAHVRLAAAATNDGATILRRPYSYNDGVNFTAERWPPWRQGMEYDAGLFFACYQRDPRTGFVKMFDRMSKLDMMNQFVTHTGGGLFACPGGIAKGEYVGQRLFSNT